MQRENRNKNVGQAMPDGENTSFKNVQGSMPLVRHCQAEPDLRVTMTSGFTLIELLVVVLIIGILAAVALSQYKMAVAKARMSNLITMLKTVTDAEETYYLANGKYTRDWEELPVSLSGTIATYNVSNDTLRGPNWEWRVTLTVQGGGSENAAQASASKVSGVIIYSFYSTHYWHGLACYAVATNDFANQVCKNLTKKTTRNATSGGGTNNVYLFN